MNTRTRIGTSETMSRWTWLTGLMLMPLAAVGCSMCCGPYDYDYPVFETRYGRMDPVYGRVGSIFSDPNVQADGPAPLTNDDAGEQPDRPNRDESPDDPEFRMDDPNIDPFEGVDPEELERLEPSRSGSQTRLWENDSWKW